MDLDTLRARIRALADVTLALGLAVLGLSFLRVLEGAKTVLTQAGINLPCPTQQILLHDQTEVTDGDRAQQCEGWPARPVGGIPLPRWQAGSNGSAAAQ